MHLNDTDKSAIETRVAAFEQATGAQAVVSVVDRCDSYPEVPWRAFALGAVLGALLAWALPLAGALLYHSTTLLLVFVFATGATAALCTILLPVTGRWLLPRERRETEVRQYAQAMFLTRELFATRDRSALLILVGLYERRAVVLVDSGISKRLPPGKPGDVESSLNAALVSGRLATAVQDALATLEAALQGTAGAVARNEIPDSVVREQGH